MFISKIENQNLCEPLFIFAVVNIRGHSMNNSRPALHIHHHVQRLIPEHKLFVDDDDEEELMMMTILDNHLVNLLASRYVIMLRMCCNLS